MVHLVPISVRFYYVLEGTDTEFFLRCGGRTDVQFSLYDKEDCRIGVRQPVVFDRIGAKTAVLRGIFCRIFFESSQIRSGTEIVYRSLISALILRTPLDCFLLSEISHWVISLQNYPVAIHIYLLRAFLNPNPHPRMKGFNVSACAVRWKIRRRRGTVIRSECP